MDENRFIEFVNFYYQHKDFKFAADAALSFGNSNLANNPSYSYPRVYFFARLAQLHPGLFVEYQFLLDELSVVPTLFLTELLEQSRPPGPANIISRITKSGRDNDCLWAEFSLTGDAAPVKRLIDQLERPDVIRSQLGRLFRCEAIFQVPIIVHWFNDRTRRRLTKFAGLSFNSSGEIATEGDLDFHFMIGSGYGRNLSECEPATKHLPWSIRNLDMSGSWTKVSARWSLACQAANHPKVLEICNEEMSHRTGQCLVALKDICHQAVRAEFIEHVRARPGNKFAYVL